ncbi:MAG: hypothetical protein E6Q97_20780 [Desulfurellales bacterium]|nr:MAG: hypothetical protein E6Q97_20780 [Desulfurellales bacterium]
MSVLDGVLSLASHGLFPVRLHYPIFHPDRVSCSCGNSECKGKGKHPVGNQWGKSATDEEGVLRDQWSGADWNVGIILGLCHGIPADRAIIDIEDDTLEGRALADALLGDYPTPTYTSGKSLHRLYRWSEKLPPVANMTISGLEFRFGGKGKETQSVAPPSKHYTGAEYRWTDGKSLDDLPIANLPPHVIEYLCEEYARANSGGPTGTSTTDARKFRSPIGKIGPGARHHSLLTQANHLWRVAFRLNGINGLDEQDVVDQVWMWLAGANLLVCDPPKSEAELQVICNSSQKFMQAELLKELEEKEQMTIPKEPSAADDKTFMAYLHRNKIRLLPDERYKSDIHEPDRIDQWVADWFIEYITKGDEDLVQITINGVENPIVMKSEEFIRPTIMARRVHQETQGKIILDQTYVFWDWKSIWEGRPNDKKKANGITRGLREYLTTNAKVSVQKENSLADQIEDLIVSLAGPKAVLIQKYRESLEKKFVHHAGRLKLAPGTEELTSQSLPEDPKTGYYPWNNQIWLGVKLDELSKRYRSSYGGGVTSRQIHEAVESLGFLKKKTTLGGVEGRWWMKQQEIL